MKWLVIILGHLIILTIFILLNSEVGISTIFGFNYIECEILQINQANLPFMGLNKISHSLLVGKEVFKPEKDVIIG